MNAMSRLPPWLFLAERCTLQMGSLLQNSGRRPVSRGGWSELMQLSQLYGNTPTMPLFLSYSLLSNDLALLFPPLLVQSLALTDMLIIVLAPVTPDMSIVSCPPGWKPLLMMNSPRLTPWGKPGEGPFNGGVPKAMLPLMHFPGGGWEQFG